MISKEELFNLINKAMKIIDIKIKNNLNKNESLILIKLKNYCDSHLFNCVKCSKSITTFDHKSDYRNFLVRLIDLVFRAEQFIEMSKKNNHPQKIRKENRVVKNVVRIVC